MIGRLLLAFALVFVSLGFVLLAMIVWLVTVDLLNWWEVLGVCVLLLLATLRVEVRLR